MSKDIKLEKCECLTKHEKNIMTTALKSASVDAEILLSKSYRGENVVGMSARDIKEGLETLIGNYSELNGKVEKTPTCK